MKKILLSALFMSVVSMTAFADSSVQASGAETVDTEIRLIGTLNGGFRNFSCMVNFNDNSSPFYQKPGATVRDLIADLENWYPRMNVQSIALDTTDNDAPQNTTSDTTDNDAPQPTDNDAPQNTTFSGKYTFRGNTVNEDSKIEDLNLTDKSVFFMEYDVATPVQASGTATVQASSVS